MFSFRKKKVVEDSTPSTDCKTLIDQWIAEEFAEGIEYLNQSKLIPCEKEIGNTYKLPYVVIEGDGFTVQEGSSGAFMLNPPARFDVTHANSKMILYRVSISYERIARWSNNKQLFLQDMSSLLNKGQEKFIERIKKEFGDCDKYYGSTYITIKSPGNRSKVEYLVELTHAAGFELRFYCDLAVTKPKEEKKDEGISEESSVLPTLNR